MHGCRYADVQAQQCMVSFVSHSLAFTLTLSLSPIDTPLPRPRPHLDILCAQSRSPHLLPLLRSLSLPLPCTVTRLVATDLPTTPARIRRPLAGRGSHSPLRAPHSVAGRYPRLSFCLWATSFTSRFTLYDSFTCAPAHSFDDIIRPLGH